MTLAGRNIIRPRRNGGRALLNVSAANIGQPSHTWYPNRRVDPIVGCSPRTNGTTESTTRYRPTPIRARAEKKKATDTARWYPYGNRLVGCHRVIVPATRNPTGGTMANTSWSQAAFMAWDRPTTRYRMVMSTR